MLVEFREYSLQVEVVEVTHNNKGRLQMRSLSIAGGSLQFFYCKLSNSIRGRNAAVTTIVNSLRRKVYTEP